MKAQGVSYSNLSQEQKDNIVFLFNQGYCYDDIIKEIGTTRRAVPAVIKEYGVYGRRKTDMNLMSHFSKQSIQSKKHTC